jgi:DNA-binding XRE family transcriptional regulator
MTITTKGYSSRKELLEGSETLRSGLQKELKDRKFKEAFEAHYLEAIIAEKMHLMREKRHLTQKQLADRVGMAQNAVSRIEKGENSLTLRTVQRVAAALGYIVEIEFKPSKKKSLAVA